MKFSFFKCGVFLLPVAMAFLVCGCTHEGTRCDKAPKYGTNLAGTSNVIVDIGMDDGNVNFSTLHYADGIRCVFHELTRGADGEDGAYAGREEAARRDAPSLIWGAYHFATPCGSDQEVQQQAKRFLARAYAVAASHGNEKKPVLLAVDVEDGSQEHMSFDQVAVFADYVHQKTNVYPIIYTNPCEVMDDLDGLKPESVAILKQCPLWVSAITIKPIKLPLWKRWDIWQYTGDVDEQVGTQLPYCPSTVQGLWRNSPKYQGSAEIYNSADRDIFNGNAKDFDRFLAKHLVVLPRGL